MKIWKRGMLTGDERGLRAKAGRALLEVRQGKGRGEDVEGPQHNETGSGLFYCRKGVAVFAKDHSRDSHCPRSSFLQTDQAYCAPAALEQAPRAMTFADCPLLEDWETLAGLETPCPVWLYPPTYHSD